MVVNGVQLDAKVRAAKARLKGQLRGVRERQALYAYAEIVALRDLYRTTVQARFDLDEPRQTSLASALTYVKYVRGPARSRLRLQIHEAKRVRAELPEAVG